MQVLAPLTASPAAAAALGARDRERLRTAVRQAIWYVFFLGGGGGARNWACCVGPCLLH